jgi:serine/threonine protein kinase
VNSDQIKIGTRRYLAPEVLLYNPKITNNRFIAKNFSSFLNSDIYSYGLVMWEVISRTHFPGYIPGPYKPPFDEEAPTDPDIEKMIQIVCINKIRPTVDDRIERHELLGDRGVTRLMRECVHEEPSARHGAVRLRRNIQMLTKRANEIINK